nr:T-cell surface glycoprotein CD4-like isoform X1 [Pogona vitticeps]XP_020659808.1 T-cell surface glycoprotein CD4-like isoform X1 [Pogona vitticeps]
MFPERHEATHTPWQRRQLQRSLRQCARGGWREQESQVLVQLQDLLDKLPVCHTYRRNGAPVNMILNTVLVSFILQLGMMLPVLECLDINIVAHKPVILSCPVHAKKPQTSNKVFWKHNQKDIIKYTEGRVFKGDKSATYTFVNADNGNYSLNLINPEEGQYICKVEENILRTYDLTVWEITGSQQKYFLQGESLTLSLKQHATVMKEVKVKWVSPNKVSVTGEESHWQLRNNNQDLHIKNLEFEKDHGAWGCHIFLDNVLIISHNVNVNVIGFLKASAKDDDEMMFAVVNSNVTLSCLLNINLQDQKDILLNGEWLKDNIILGKENISSSNSTSSLDKKLPKVQFEDAGRYQCRLKLENRQLDKFIQLVVMKVFLEPSSEEGKGTLCCQVSAPAPPTTQLCWVHANTTNCSHGFLDSPFCHPVTTTGLWRCDLKVKNEEKRSVNYSTVKEEVTAMGDHAFPVTEVLSGAGVTLLLLIIVGTLVPACKMIRRKRQQVKRMALAKQHLLAKRTCQCQRELTNDYYHT